MALCRITGTFYLPASVTSTPEPAIGLRVKVMYGTVNGQVLQSTAKTYSTSTIGVVTFYAPKLSRIWMWADGQGFGRRAFGVPVDVPNSDMGRLEMQGGRPVIIETGPPTFLLLQAGGRLTLQQGGSLELQG